MVIKDKKLLLIRHKKLGVWLPPGGHVEAGEFPSEAAIRETKEEVGISVKLLGEDRVVYNDGRTFTEKLPFTIVNEDVPYREGKHNHFDMVYLATPASGRLKLNEKEATEMRWFSYSDMKNLETFPSVAAVAMNALIYAGAYL